MHYAGGWANRLSYKLKVDSVREWIRTNWSKIARDPKRLVYISISPIVDVGVFMRLEQSNRTLMMYEVEFTTLARGKGLDSEGSKLGKATGRARSVSRVYKKDVSGYLRILPVVCSSANSSAVFSAVMEASSAIASRWGTLASFKEASLTEKNDWNTVEYFCKSYIGSSKKKCHKFPEKHSSETREKEGQRDGINLAAESCTNTTDKSGRLRLTKGDETVKTCSHISNEEYSPQNRLTGSIVNSSQPKIESVYFIVQDDIDIVWDDQCICGRIIRKKIQVLFLLQEEAKGVQVLCLLHEKAKGVQVLCLLREKAKGVQVLSLTRLVKRSFVQASPPC
ncbi:hypothetical protein IEQ34_012194 [Dendrobium chrysotoxum]|uniref:Uncharacterized protein n=1 Tax=Dendrobium chrysotoxum TaxID=161865 RepID=A0AAV7GVX5_DENCH|nr:hypothetical protein IEQ34_012194 [Dendrobium chrysotoxum]